MQITEDHIDFALQPLAGPPVSLIGPNRLALEIEDTPDGIAYVERDWPSRVTIETGMIVREDRR